jgi:hypothetical protein
MVLTPLMEALEQSVLILVLAQAGLFAAQNFNFSPFDTMISQVDLVVTFFSGKVVFL